MYSYISAYLKTAVNLPVQIISIVLFLYGLMNIVGNTIAGRGLSARPNRFIGIQPVLIATVYLLMLGFGMSVVPAVFLVLFWGVLAGFVANTIQYWVTSAAPGAPEFANGLYLTAANLGVSAAAPFCGIFITRLGIQSAPIGGIALAFCSAVCIFIKVFAANRKRQVEDLTGMEERWISLR